MTASSRHCKECAADIAHRYWNTTFCGKSCFKTHQAKLKSAAILAANPAALQCRCCQLYVDKGLIKHLTKLHSMSIADYKKSFGDDAPIVSPATSKKLSDNIKGEKNVWFNHGDKLSRFSKKHAHYDGLSEDEKRVAISAFVKGRDYDPANASTRLEYYLAKGLNEDDAKAALTKRQTTFSLEKCIEKYGQAEGLKRWQDRQEKWQRNLLSKSHSEQERINNAKMRKSGMISKIARSLFQAIDIPGARWADSGGEVMIKKADKSYMVDYVLGNKAIEFNGDFWHANPKKFAADDIVKFGPNRTSVAKEIWEKDAIKNNIIKNNYSLLVVWESDYKKDPEGTIHTCRTFLTT
jgi:hypothetical protein